ncbi:MAG: ATP-binding protein [Candidatus Aenigmarchaeota archaeon]|nr:ATP-binding protein [Candidatus Aenigmarchaeota archaeon]
MLIEFKVSNFLSIKEAVVLSLDSTSSKKLSTNTFNELDYSLLKSVVIYGANASGKSNIINAILFALKIVHESINFKVDTKINRTPYLLNRTNKSKPSKFEFTFIKNNIRYVYGFSCTENGFVEEYLRYKPRGENWKFYFKRDERSKEKSKRFKFNVDAKKQETWGDETIEKRLYLPVAVNDRNYEPLKEVYDFIVKDIVVVMGTFNDNWRRYTRNRLINDAKFKSWVLEVMRKADFGGIVDLVVEKQKVPLHGIELKIEKGLLSHKQLEDKEEEIYNLRYIHKNEKGESVEFKENLESAGTNKTLDILGPIYNILETGKTLFIDEFELHLHPNITEFIIKLFHGKHNKKNGQLIVTTHDTTLLKNKGLFRLDQVYICSKDPNKWTELKSLADFDLRDSLSFENAYLNGRVGGLPFIDETFFEG